VALVTVLAVGVAAGACGSPMSDHPLPLSAGTDVKATLALTAAGGSATYRADYVVTVPGSTGGVPRTLVVVQKPPRAVYAVGADVVYTSSTASDRVHPDASSASLVCSASTDGRPACVPGRPWPPGTAASAASVARGLIVGMLDHDAQLIEEGDPGGALGSVRRSKQVVGGQPSTCLRVTTPTSPQVVCLTPSGIPTLVTTAASTAVARSVTAQVTDGDVAPTGATPGG
jgi:hypothetical protein